MMYAEEKLSSGKDDTYTDFGVQDLDGEEVAPMERSQVSVQEVRVTHVQQIMQTPSLFTMKTLPNYEETQLSPKEKEVTGICMEILRKRSNMATGSTWKKPTQTLPINSFPVHPPDSDKFLNRSHSEEYWGCHPYMCMSELIQNVTDYFATRKVDGTAAPQMKMVVQPGEDYIHPDSGYYGVGFRYPVIFRGKRKRAGMDIVDVSSTDRKNMRPFVFTGTFDPIRIEVWLVGDKPFHLYTMNVCEHSVVIAQWFTSILPHAAFATTGGANNKRADDKAAGEYMDGMKRLVMALYTNALSGEAKRDGFGPSYNQSIKRASKPVFHATMTGPDGDVVKVTSDIISHPTHASGVYRCTYKKKMRGNSEEHLKSTFRTELTYLNAGWDFIRALLEALNYYTIPPPNTSNIFYNKAGTHFFGEAKEICLDPGLAKAIKILGEKHPEYNVSPICPGGLFINGRKVPICEKTVAKGYILSFGFAPKKSGRCTDNPTNPRVSMTGPDRMRGNLFQIRIAIAALFEDLQHNEKFCKLLWDDLMAPRSADCAEDSPAHPNYLLGIGIVNMLPRCHDAIKRALKLDQIVIDPYNLVWSGGIFGAFLQYLEQNRPMPFTSIKPPPSSKCGLYTALVRETPVETVAAMVLNDILQKTEDAQRMPSHIAFEEFIQRIGEATSHSFLEKFHTVGVAEFKSPEFVLLKNGDDVTFTALLPMKDIAWLDFITTIGELVKDINSLQCALYSALIFKNILTDQKDDIISEEKLADIYDAIKEDLVVATDTEKELRNVLQIDMHARIEISRDETVADAQGNGDTFLFEEQAPRGNVYEDDDDDVDAIESDDEF